MHTLNIKPLSINEARCVRKGRIAKTKECIAYEAEVYYKLPRIKIPAGKFKIVLVWGFSNMGADADNPVKTFVDCLESKYGFNDSNVWEYSIIKKKVKKGQEYIAFDILPYLDTFKMY